MIKISIWSGKCDLADTIMMQKHRTKDGSDKKEDLDEARVLYSDEMECFEIFKEKTGGVIYQYISFELTKYNIEKEIESNKFLEKVEENGKTYYKFFGKTYKTLKSLNKHGYWTTIEIHFETLLDIIPYYPYLISSACYTQDKYTINISDESFVDSEYKEHREYGWDNSVMKEFYKKRLQEHYIEVVLQYFNYPEREVTETLVIKDEQVKTTYPLDYSYPITVKRDRHDWVWSSPKIVNADEGIVDVSQVWTGEMTDGSEITLTYAKKREPKLYLS